MHLRKRSKCRIQGRRSSGRDFKRREEQNPLSCNEQIGTTQERDSAHAVFWRTITERDCGDFENDTGKCEGIIVSGKA